MLPTHRNVELGPFNFFAYKETEARVSDLNRFQNRAARITVITVIDSLGMLVRNATLATIVVVSILTGAAAWADEPRKQRPFLFQWISSFVVGCPRLDAKWQEPIAKTLALARSNTQGFLPAEWWDVPNQAYESRSFRVDSGQCQEFVDYYSDSKLRMRLRADAVKSVMAMQVYKCAVWFPSLEGEIRQAWTTAFTRNGLPVSDVEVDQGVAESRSRGASSLPTSDNQYPECRNMLGFLSNEFDSVFTEEHIRAFLIEDLNKDPNKR